MHCVDIYSPCSEKGATPVLSLTLPNADRFSKIFSPTDSTENSWKSNNKLECGPMPNVMAALPNIGGALCSTPQSLADAQYWNAVQ